MSIISQAMLAGKILPAWVAGSEDERLFSQATWQLGFQKSPSSSVFVQYPLRSLLGRFARLAIPSWSSWGRVVASLDGIKWHKIF